MERERLDTDDCRIDHGGSWNHDRVCAGMLPPAMYRRSLLAWIAPGRHGDTWGLRRAVLRHLVIRHVRA